MFVCSSVEHTKGEQVMALIVPPIRWELPVAETEWLTGAADKSLYNGEARVLCVYIRNFCTLLWSVFVCVSKSTLLNNSVVPQPPLVGLLFGNFKATHTHFVQNWLMNWSLWWLTDCVLWLENCSQRNCLTTGHTPSTQCQCRWIIDDHLCASYICIIIIISCSSVQFAEVWRPDGHTLK